MLLYVAQTNWIPPSVESKLSAWFLNRTAKTREHGVEERRIKEQQKIELDRSRQAALQTYLDRVSALLRSKWRESGQGFLEANIIRAQTLMVLRQLDGRRNDLVLSFLRESGLMEEGEAVVTLRGVDLAGVDLTRAKLAGGELTMADLRYARLSGADLREA